MKKNTLSRRDFIKINAIAGSMLVGGKLLIDLAKNEFVTVRETRTLMGTIINLTVAAQSKASGDAAVEATFAELERQVGIFSHRTADSPLSILNKTGMLANPPQELVQVISQAAEISKITAGAFDVTIKPLLDLYSSLQPSLPDRSELESILPLVDQTQLSVTSQEISLKKPGMAVTLDGIAKGFIVDAGTALLNGLGFGNVFVEAGGDLMASGAKEYDLPWKIGIRSPRGDQGEILAKLNLTNQAAATSGDYFQYFSPDLENHHIIDPRIGRSAPGLASVTVVSDTAMLSDALATALMVMGPEEGLGLIESIPGVEAYLISKDLRVWRSAGLGEI